MTALTEGRHPGDFIISEQPGAGSRDAVTVTVPAATTLEAGTVLGQISSSGKYAPYDDAKSDGLEQACAVLYADIVNDAAAPADLDGVVLNFGAEVRADDLVWGTGVDETAGLADLRTVFIKARD